MSDIISRFAADPAVSTIITVVVAAVIALWLLAALWVHGDTSHRTGSDLAALASAGWVLLSTPLLLPLSLAAYAFVRPAEPAKDRRVRDLTAAFVADSLVAAACRDCGSIVEATWRRCPTCTTWLAAPCAGCGRWADVELGACPWCGEADRERPTVEEPSMLLDGRPYLGLPGESVAVMAPAPRPATLAAAAMTHGPALAGRVPSARAAERRTGNRDRVTVTAGPGRPRRNRLRPSRPFQRRAPGAGARSLEHGTSGGHPGVRSRS